MSFALHATAGGCLRSSLGLIAKRLPTHFVNPALHSESARNHMNHSGGIYAREALDELCDLGVALEAEEDAWGRHRLIHVSPVVLFPERLLHSA